MFNPKVDSPLFATTAVPLQLYHFPREKILAFKYLKVLVTTIDALGRS